MSYVWFLDVFSFLNFRAETPAVRTCVVPPNYYAQLVAATALPILGVFGLLGYQQFLKSKHRRWEHIYGLLLLLTYCVFPAVSQTIFQIFNCDNDFDGDEGYLRLDYNIRCHGPKFQLYLTYACVMILVCRGRVETRAGPLLSPLRRRPVFVAPNPAAAATTDDPRGTRGAAAIRSLGRSARRPRRRRDHRRSARHPRRRRDPHRTLRAAPAAPPRPPSDDARGVRGRDPVETHRPWRKSLAGIPWASRSFTRSTSITNDSSWTRRRRAS